MVLCVYKTYVTCVNILNVTRVQYICVMVWGITILGMLAFLREFFKGLVKSERWTPTDKNLDVRGTF